MAVRSIVGSRRRPIEPPAGWASSRRQRQKGLPRGRIFPACATSLDLCPASMSRATRLFGRARSPQQRPACGGYHEIGCGAEYPIDPRG